MQVIEAQCASILEPHDHLHINHVSAEMSLRYGRLFDTTIRDEYQRACSMATLDLRRSG